MADTQWLNDFEARTIEVTEAKADHLSETWPKIYPVSGPDGTEAPPRDAWYKLTPER